MNTAYNKFRIYKGIWNYLIVDGIYQPETELPPIGVSVVVLFNREGYPEHETFAGRQIGDRPIDEDDDTAEDLEETKPFITRAKGAPIDSSWHWEFPTGFAVSGSILVTAWGYEND